MGSSSDYRRGNKLQQVWLERVLAPSSVLAYVAGDGIHLLA